MQVTVECHAEEEGSQIRSRRCRHGVHTHTQKELLRRPRTLRTLISTRIPVMILIKGRGFIDQGSTLDSIRRTASHCIPVILAALQLFELLWVVFAPNP